MVKGSKAAIGLGLFIACFIILVLVLFADLFSLIVLLLDIARL